MIHILPENSNGGQSGSILRGCTILTPAHAPAVQVESAVGVEITQNRFVGGGVQLLLLNTAFEDGRTPGYSEQHSIHANDFENPSIAGIEFAKGNGTDSMEYGAVEWSNHFQLPCGAAAIQVDTGITIQGGKLGGHINTTSSPCAPGHPAMAIRKAGAIYRGTSADFTGEDTGNLGTGNLFFLGGSGAATLEVRTAMVTGMSYKQNSSDPSHFTMPYFNFHSLFGEEACMQMSDEGQGAGYVLQRKGNFVLCQNRVRLVKGAETDDSASLDVYHFNDGTQFDDARSLTSTFRAIPGMGVAIGQGFSHGKPDGSCPDAAGCIAAATQDWLPASAAISVSASGTALALTSTSGTQYRSTLSFGYKRPGGTQRYSELWSMGVDARTNGGKDFFLYNKATGHTPLRFDADDTPHFSKGWSGTCASGHALVVTDGVVTGCN